MKMGGLRVLRRAPAGLFLCGFGGYAKKCARLYGRMSENGGDRIMTQGAKEASWSRKEGKDEHTGQEAEAAGIV